MFNNLKSLTAKVLALNFHPAHVLFTERALTDNYVNQASTACRFLIACSEQAMLASEDWRILRAAGQCVADQRGFLASLEKRVGHSTIVIGCEVQEASFRMLAEAPRDSFDRIYLEVMPVEVRRTIDLHCGYLSQVKTAGLTKLAHQTATYLDSHLQDLKEIAEAKFVHEPEGSVINE